MTTNRIFRIPTVSRNLFTIKVERENIFSGQIWASKCINYVFQVKNQPEEFKGDFDAIVVVVGANNIGQYAVRQAVRAIYDTVELLSSFNAHAKVLACEVGFP